MSTIHDIVKSEHPRDVILFCTRNNKAISYSSLDGLYSRYGRDRLSNIALLQLLETMRNEGLIEDTDGGLRRGPNWKEPNFTSEKKYALE